MSLTRPLSRERRRVPPPVRSDNNSSSIGNGLAVAGWLHAPAVAVGSPRTAQLVVGNRREPSLVPIPLTRAAAATPPRNTRLPASARPTAATMAWPQDEAERVAEGGKTEPKTEPAEPEEERTPLPPPPPYASLFGPPVVPAENGEGEEESGLAAVPNGLVADMAHLPPHVADSEGDGGGLDGYVSPDEYAGEEDENGGYRSGTRGRQTAARRAGSDYLAGDDDQRMTDADGQYDVVSQAKVSLLARKPRQIGKNAFRHSQAIPQPADGRAKTLVLAGGMVAVLAVLVAVLVRLWSL